MKNNLIEQNKNMHLYFQVGDNKYAIMADNILEVVKLPALDYPQQLPHNILGLLKYNSFVINVIDIRFYLNISVNGYNTDNELIIVKTDEIILGIVVDKVFGLLSFDNSVVNHVPFIDSHTLIDALYKYNNETVYVINVYSIETILKSSDLNNEHNANIPELFPKDKKSCELMQARLKKMTNKSSKLLIASSHFGKDKYLSFNLNEDFYCISLNYVKEILKNASITKIPGVPPFVEGIITLRGNDLTVINIKNLLALPSKEKEQTNSIIVIEIANLCIAILVDKINEIFEYSEDVQNKKPENKFLDKFLYNSYLYTLLNIEEILSEKKIAITDL